VGEGGGEVGELGGKLSRQGGDGGGELLVLGLQLNYQSMLERFFDGCGLVRRSELGIGDFALGEGTIRMSVDEDGGMARVSGASNAQHPSNTSARQG
jgi:hypothetical protein